MPFVQFVALMPYMTAESIKSLVLIPPPRKFCKRDVYLKTCCALASTLTGIPADRVASRPAIEVLGIVNMVQGEMSRIGKLFQALNTDKTSEEMSAGIERLNFGAFGIVDWYAQRMGIVDHEEVFNTPWARIYQCMKIDHENNEFEKRYRKIIEQRSKRK